MTHEFEYRRHPDDELVDYVTLHSSQCTVTVWVVPRYKTSGLSGDEWRVSAHAHFLLDPKGRSLLHDQFPRMAMAVAGVAHLFVTTLREVRERVLPLDRALVREVEFSWKGIPVWTHNPNISMLEAIAALPWWWSTWTEQPGAKLPSEQDRRDRCFQPSCIERATRTYRIKTVRCADPTRHVLPPEELLYKEARRRFCEAHAKRGDCGLDDRDDNYEPVDGSLGPLDAAVTPEAQWPSLVVF